MVGPASGTLPPPISKYASILKYFEVRLYRSVFDIKVQHFDVEVQHFDIEATKNFDIEVSSKFLRYRSCMLRYWVSKSKGFDIEVYALRYRSVYTSISIVEYFDIKAPLLNIIPYIEALRY